MIQEIIKGLCIAVSRSIRIQGCKLKHACWKQSRHFILRIFRIFSWMIHK